jgi:hypothetical protein
VDGFIFITFSSLAGKNLKGVEIQKAKCCRTPAETSAAKLSPGFPKHLEGQTLLMWRRR